MYGYTYFYGIYLAGTEMWTGFEEGLGILINDVEEEVDFWGVDKKLIKVKK